MKLRPGCVIFCHGCRRLEETGDFPVLLLNYKTFLLCVALCPVCFYLTLNNTCGQVLKHWL